MQMKENEFQKNRERNLVILILPQTFIVYNKIMDALIESTLFSGTLMYPTVKITIRFIVLMNFHQYQSHCSYEPHSSQGST